LTENDNVIELLGVEKSFGAQKVLKGVNLAVKRGSTVVIVGGSGQGKSVVIRHMLGLVKPDAGSVMAFGVDLAKSTKHELNEVRKRFGVLFQNAALLDSLTVYENVALPLHERTKMNETEVRHIVEDRLDMMDLHDVNNKYPAQLSGGMKKRVGLARALALDPEIVFFDEPTTGLDVHKSNEIYRLFRRTKARLGYTAVIVSHDAPKIFKLADRVALLAGGKVAACLSPENFQLSEQEGVKKFVETTMGPIYSSNSEEGLAP
jgi:phospholipid/cholesterol/gamma-HCH transport system ATP-binding protein